MSARGAIYGGAFRAVKTKQPGTIGSPTLAGRGGGD